MVLTLYSFDGVASPLALRLALPATSNTELALSVITLPATAVLALGVKVALQFVPPSVETGSVSVPLGTFRSVALKSVTASLKVKLTCRVWLPATLLSAMVMVAVGRTVSMR